MPKLSPDISVRRGSGLVDRLMFGGQEVFDGIPAQVQSILNKYPQGDAHLFIPGIGQISNFSAGNYSLTDGVSGATVDQTVGRVNDAAGKLGVELVSNPGPFVNTNGWAGGQATISATGGEILVTQTTGAYGQATLNPAIPLVVGKTYRMEGTFRKAGTATSAIIQVQRGADGSYANIVQSPLNTSGVASSFSGQFVAASTYAIISFTVSGAAGATGFLTSFSVREVIGTHATQGTTANMPTLRKAGGLYSWEFDGTTDYLKLDAPLFGMADDHCVIAGAKNTSNSAVSKSVFSQRNSALDNSIVCQLDFTATNQYPRVIWRDDAGLIANLTYSVASLNTPAVLTAISGTALKTLRVNGVQVASSTTAPTTTTITTATVGCNARTTTEFFAGNLYPIIAIKGTVSPADVITLENFIIKLTGAIRA